MNTRCNTRHHLLRRGLSLTEVLVAAVILAAVGIPVFSVFLQSKRSISRTDTRREVRFFIKEIMAHINRHSLHDLWDNFGPAPYSPAKMLGQIALRDAAGKLLPDPEANPLGFTQDFLDDLRREGYDGQVKFEFYTREELRIRPDDSADPEIGLLHMQAGWAEVSLLDITKEDRPRIAVWKQPIMCPAIVGRPGLKLSSCPAIQKAVKEQYGPLLAQREAALP